MLRHFRRFTPVKLLALGLLIFSGCNSGPATGQPAGKVTLNGKPVSGAEMQFLSVANADDVFFGISDRMGDYHVSYRTYNGLPMGRYKVTIAMYALPGGVLFPPGEKADALKGTGKLLKQTYAFEQDIAAGGNEINFELSKGQKTEVVE